MMVLQVGFLGDVQASAICYARMGLSDLLEGPARSYLETRDAELLLGTGARGLITEGGKVAAVDLDDGSRLEGYIFVSALPPDALPLLLPPPWRSHPFFARLAAMPASPIVNAYLIYDRPVTDLAFAACLEGPVQWVFNKGHMWGKPDLDGRYLCVSLSDAREFISMAEEELQRLLEAEMAQLLPQARGAKLLAFRAVRQPRATFAAV